MAMKKRFYSVNGQMMGYESGGVKKDFLTDHLGSITAEIDQTQTRTYDTRYSAYGRNNWSTGTGCGFGWVGSYGYRETGLFHMSHYVRARHYSYITGNWSTVDPLWPDESAYGYVGGRATNALDYTGRACGDPEDDCTKDPCKYAETHEDKGLPKDDPCYGKKMDCGEPGGIICCNGKPTICVWPKNLSKPFNSGERKGQELVIACIRRHEGIHKPGVKCAKKGAHPGGGDPKDIPHNECTAWKDSLACLLDAYNKGCKGDSFCKGYVGEQIFNSCEKLTIYKCGVLPSICKEFQ